jgi:hypothetical protein
VSICDSILLPAALDFAAAAAQAAWPYRDRPNRDPPNRDPEDKRRRALTNHA